MRREERAALTAFPVSTRVMLARDLYAAVFSGRWGGLLIAIFCTPN